METFFGVFVGFTISREYLTYKEWKQSRKKDFCTSFLVSTLPIRNGNVFTREDASRGSQRRHVSTLPIRNGNTHRKSFFSNHSCEYLTYKEWKPRVIRDCYSITHEMREYLTYKEWKLHSGLVMIIHRNVL